MREHKRGMRESKLSTRGFISWFGLTLSNPTSTLLKHSIKSIASRQLSSLFRDSSWVANETYQVTAVTLIPLFTKELAHEGWGLQSPRPPHKVVDAAPHQAGGSLTCRRATNAPRGRHTEIQNLVHSRTMHKAATPCSLTHLRANLALTLLKVC